MDLQQRLAAAKSEVARLEREAAAAPCREVGHRWASVGGANCGCDDGECSIPVYECKVCGECDYGENAEAAAVKRNCMERFEP